MPSDFHSLHYDELCPSIKFCKLGYGESEIRPTQKNRVRVHSTIEVLRMNCFLLASKLHGESNPSLLSWPFLS